jgi:hypothetical protein
MFLVLGFVTGTTTYALCQRDVEVVFSVIDAEATEPISGAAIDLQELRHDDGRDSNAIKLVTGDQGEASYFYEKMDCEDIIKPFRKTWTEVERRMLSLCRRLCRQGRSVASHVEN